MQVKMMKELLLPIPERLVSGLEKNLANAQSLHILKDCLTNGLQDSGPIEQWLLTHAAVIAELPPIAENEQLSPRHVIYDQYFNVYRHGGSGASIRFALAQALMELSLEFQGDSSLSEEEIKRLLDGLTAVLEVASEC